MARHHHSLWRSIWCFTCPILSSKSWGNATDNPHRICSTKINFVVILGNLDQNWWIIQQKTKKASRSTESLTLSFNDSSGLLLAGYAFGRLDGSEIPIPNPPGMDRKKTLYINNCGYLLRINCRISEPSTVTKDGHLMIRRTFHTIEEHLNTLKSFRKTFTTVVLLNEKMQLKIHFSLTSSSLQFHRLRWFQMICRVDMYISTRVSAYTFAQFCWKTSCTS